MSCFHMYMNVEMEGRKEIVISWSREEYIILPNGKVLFGLIQYYWEKEQKAHPHNTRKL